MRALMTAVSVALLGSALVVSPAAAAGSVGFSTVLTGYSRPVLVTAPRGSSRRIFIVEQTGRIRVATYSNGSWRKLGTFLDIRDRVKSTFGEQGLLGLAFDPDYASNRRFYVNYTRKPDGDTVVAEFRRSTSSANRATKGTARQVIRINQPYSNHNGGMLAFGPDENLYISTGDGGSGGDPGNRAQSKSSLLGKILRIDPHKSGSRAYTIPSSNPFVGRTGSDAIWAFGLRNPWRFSFDRSNGDLWIGDVGQENREEIDLATNSSGRGKGVNYGWRRCEGNIRYPGGGSCNFGKSPLKTYRTSDTPCGAVTGGYAYRGPNYSAWQGRYIYGDYCTGHVWVINKSGSVRVSRDTSYQISSFGEDGAGRLFMTDLGGRILLVRFSGTP
jgi:glucose/arabinose dehydrogenase